MTAYDVVVAGAGHNSLITAAYLARAGLRVLALERAAVAGGDATTEEVTLPGFRHDMCGSAHTIFQSSPIVRDDELELARHGLRYLFPDPVVVMPFRDGESLTMWRDRARTRAEIARYSAPDAAAYDTLLGDWDRIKAVVGRARYSPDGDAAALADALARSHPDAARWHEQSALDVIRERFAHPRVRAFLAWISLMAMAYIDRPGTGLNALSLVAGRQAFSWTTAEGGSQALPDALVRIVREHGGDVRTGCEVTRVLVEGGRAVGVATAEAAYRAERAVVSTIHPQHLVAAAPELATALAPTNAAWRTNVTMFVTHYALARAPRYRASPGAIPSVAAAVAGSLDELAAALEGHRNGRVTTETAPLLCISASVVDPSRAPEGRHTLKLVGFQPYALADGGPARWDAIKQDVSAALFERYLAHTSGLDHGDVLASHVESPLDLERRNPHNFRGSCHAGDGSRLLAHRLPLAGLYQTGASTIGGGSISGAPGRNCAQVVLADLGIPFERAIHPRAAALA